MNIGLDYDDTYTADPILWRGFISNAILHGHTVYIVTFRSHENCYVDRPRYPRLDPHLLDSAKVQLIPTSLKAKKPFCEALGIKIDVWIDDNPAAIYKDHPACYEKEF